MRGHSTPGDLDGYFTRKIIKKSEYADFWKTYYSKGDIFDQDKFYRYIERGFKPKYYQPTLAENLLNIPPAEASQPVRRAIQGVLDWIFS